MAKSADAEYPVNKQKKILKENIHNLKAFESFCVWTKLWKSRYENDFSWQFFLLHPKAIHIILLSPIFAQLCVIREINRNVFLAAVFYHFLLFQEVENFIDNHVTSKVVGGGGWEGSCRDQKSENDVSKM